MQGDIEEIGDGHHVARHLVRVIGLGLGLGLGLGFGFGFGFGLELGLEG